MQIVAILIPIIVLSLFLYFLLLGVNNFIWAVKGLSIEKESLSYKSRKRLFKILAVPIAVLILMVWGILSKQ